MLALAEAVGGIEREIACFRWDGEDLNAGQDEMLEHRLTRVFERKCRLALNCKNAPVGLAFGS